jgi:hypothetical protein
LFALSVGGFPDGTEHGCIQNLRTGVRGQRSVYVRKTANPRTHANFGCDTDGAEHHRPRELEVGTEKAEPLLDAEHGLVLRRAGLPDGEEAFVREVEEIVYAQAVPLETFAFESCPRERRRTDAPSRRRPPSTLRLRSRRCLCSGSTRSRRWYPAGEAGGVS